MSKVNVGLIGCGTIANLAHIPSYLKIEDINIVYCCDIIEERAKKAAEQFGCKYVLDYHEILQDESVDAITVCTPNGMHEQIVIDGLKAGKNVFCEKPLSVSYEACERILKIARETGKLCDVGLCNRYRKAVLKVKQLIDTGRLGELYHIYCSFRKHRNIPGLGGDFTTKARSGGGVLIDWGVHLFDLILFCADITEIQTVSAATHDKIGKDIKGYRYLEMWAGPPKYDGTFDVEDTVTGFIRTNGPTISFNGAWAQNLEEESMYIEFLGSKGGVKVDYYGMYKLFTCEDDVFYAQEASFVDNDKFLSELTAFVSSCQTGIKNINNIENVLLLHKLLDRIYESANVGKELSL